MQVFCNALVCFYIIGIPRRFMIVIKIYI